MLAESMDLRIVGIDRPGIGSSTPFVYDDIAGFVPDLEVVADSLGLDEMVVIGLSGGGPYALAAGALLPDRVSVVGSLGGVAPTVGQDAIQGGLVGLGRRLAPLVSVARLPLGVGLTGAVRLSRPLASPALDLYARLSPAGDRALLRRPEFKAMFLDDLINGSRKQLTAPLADVLLFSRHWGFELSDVQVPVQWWHGDADHIVPFEHGVHVWTACPMPSCTSCTARATWAVWAWPKEILGTLVDVGDVPPSNPGRRSSEQPSPTAPAADDDEVPAAGAGRLEVLGMTDPSKPTIGLALRDSRTTPGPLPYRPGAPNVVMIVLDDLGFAQLGCYGSDIDTPNIDRLAARGVRFSGFHTTAICSPTRACLLTGRNHHRVGMGMLPDIPLPYPGYTGRLPRSAGTMAQILGDAGWSTTAIGKWHLVPRDERATGPYDQWPTRLGFDRYYGFLNGETNQWTPNLVRDQTHVEPPATPEDGYHLDVDLADEAIAQLRRAAAAQPGPAVPALVRHRVAARTPPGAAGVDRALPGPLRRRVGRVAGAHARPPGRARPAARRRRAVPPTAVGRALGRRRRGPPPALRPDDGGVRRRRHPPRPPDRTGPRRGRARRRTTRWSSSCRTTAARPKAVRTVRGTSCVTTSATSPTTSRPSWPTSTTSVASARAATTPGVGRWRATRRSPGGSATRSRAACGTR